MLLAFTLDRALAEALDHTSAARGENRSQFIRRALVNYLQALGHPVAESAGFAPDRRLVLNDDPAQAAILPPPPRPANYKDALKRAPRRKKPAL